MSARANMWAGVAWFALAFLLAATVTLAAPPAHAADNGGGIYGHRGIPNASENTPRVIRTIARHTDGVGAEIDAARLKTGEWVAVHDETWGRVADPDTMAGVPARIDQTTWAQFQQIRLRSGIRPATLEQILTTAGRYDVPLLIELKRTPSAGDAEWMIDHAADAGAGVRWWSCANMRAPEVMDAAGARRIGVKTSGSCGNPTAPSLAERGVTFITLAVADVTPWRVRNYAKHGIAVRAGNTVGPNQWRAVKRLTGGWRFMTGDPLRAYRYTNR